MNYEAYLGSTANLEFIPDEKTADAVIKAALGMVASRLPERAAVEFAAAMPYPLDYAKLRGHQAGQDEFSVSQYLGVLEREFDLGADDARTAAATVIELAKRDLGPRLAQQVQRQLPPDWATFFEEA